jgi:hypothetical protein
MNISNSNSKEYNQQNSKNIINNILKDFLDSLNLSFVDRGVVNKFTPYENTYNQVNYLFHDNSKETNEWKKRQIMNVKIMIQRLC